MNESPLGWLVGGVIVSVVGGALLGADGDVPTFVGAALLALGGLVVQVCAIALGVEWGMRRHEYVKARQPALHPRLRGETGA